MDRILIAVIDLMTKETRTLNAKNKFRKTVALHLGSTKRFTAFKPKETLQTLNAIIRSFFIQNYTQVQAVNVEHLNTTTQG